MLSGKKVNLRAVEPSDYELIWQWMNDAESMVYWGRPGNSVSLMEVTRQEESQAARGNSRKYMVETKDGARIGMIDYYELDWQARSAWVSILIGEQDFWGGGFGTDAMRTLLAHLFRQMGLHRVALTVHESNTRAQRSYEKSGFVREGVLRDWAFFDDHWVNGVLMSVLDREFAALE